LGAVGWLGYRQWFAAPSSGEEFDVGPLNVNRRGRFALNAPAPKEGVSLLGAGLWRIKSGDFSMNLATSVKTSDVHVYYDKRDLISPDQNTLLQAQRDILANASAAKRLSVTPEQIKQLQAIPRGAGDGMKLEAPDRDMLKSLWDAYNAAPDNVKSDRQIALLG